MHRNHGSHGHGHGGGCCSEEPPPPPPSTELVSAQPAAPPPMDIFQLSQRGLVDQVKPLIEEKMTDVNIRDKENITCLHWAAINNRIPLVQFLLEKGAEVDSLGGELMASPLQWATRQGHLEMVVLLIQRGADPSIRDIQGFNSLHLAAQFGHTMLCAYFIAKGMDVDTRDNDGHTPLMWAAMKIFAPDPVRLLISMHASLNLTDSVHGNTALHFAVGSSNIGAVTTLVSAGASKDLKNAKGQSPVDMAYANGDMHSPRSAPLRRALPRPTKHNRITDFFTKPDVARKIVLALPFFGLAGLGFSLQKMLLEDLFSGILMGIATMVMWSLVHGFVMRGNDPKISPSAMALYLGTKCLMYATVLFQFWPYMFGPEAISGYGFNLLMITTSVGLWYNFLKGHTTDPGFLPAPTKAAQHTIITLAEKGELDSSKFCTSCVLRKPYRSKHCPICKRCVAKFDHHCPFVDNCVGSRNHRYFMFYLLFLIVVIAQFWVLAFRYFDLVCPNIEGGWWTRAKARFMCSPWICWLLMNSGMHIMWVTGLTVVQLKQIGITAMTTNEEMNKWRYPHLQGRSASPWNKGVVRNFVEFFGTDPVDWTKTYTLPGERDTAFTV
eukprot:m.485374 g.485374  ORF g.485374 m.485374 type:complete len:609 (+) comp23794_c0_seq1:61-1887(+)